MKALEFFKVFAQQLRSTIAKLPPGEQYEATSSARWAMGDLQNLCTQLDTNYSTLEAELAEAVANAEKKGKEDALKDVAANGEWVRKVDHETAVNAAKQTTEKAIRDEFAATAELSKKADDARKKLIADKVFPAVVAERLPLAALVGDGAAAHCETIKGRVARVVELKLDPEKSPDAFAVCAEAGLDEEGNKAFERTYAVLKGAVATAGVATHASRTAAGGHPTATSRADGTGKPSLKSLL